MSKLSFSVASSRKKQYPTPLNLPRATPLTEVWRIGAWHQTCACDAAPGRFREHWFTGTKPFPGLPCDGWIDGWIMGSKRIRESFPLPMSTTSTGFWTHEAAAAGAGGCAVPAKDQRGVPIGCDLLCRSNLHASLNFESHGK